MARPDPKLGAKLGPRLASVVQRAMAEHSAATRHDRARVGTRAALDFCKVISQKTRGTIGEHAAQVAAAPELPEWARRTFRFIANGEGEWQALLSNAVYGSGLGSSLTAIIVNEIAPFVQRALSEAPHALLSPGGAADAAARGIADYGQMSQEANKQAISEARFAIMANAAEQFPDEGAALELLRRGQLGDREAIHWLRRRGYSVDTANLLLKLRRVEPAVADAALQVIKGIIDQAEGRRIAERNGLAAADFDNLVLMTGEPPGIQDLLFLYRRGQIDRARLEHGIRQSRVRNEWVDAILDLRFVPASTSDAVRAVIQNHLGDAEGHKIAEQNGLEPSHWRWMVESAGRPPGPMEMLGLMNRGLMTREEVMQGIRESDIKDKYIPKLLELHRRLIPERQLVQMVQHGTMSEAEATKQLAAQGYAPADARRIIHLGASQKTGHERDLAKADTLALYRDRLVDRGLVVKMLEALGYSQAEADWLLAMEDVRRDRKFHEAAIGKVGSLYVGHHTDHALASAELDALGVSHAQRDALLGLWTMERESNTRLLTEAKLTAAYKASVLNRAGYESRLLELGYRKADVAILVQLADGVGSAGASQPSS